VRVGDVVVVGTRYVMADFPPYHGRGKQEADEWTGRQFRIVGFRGRDAVLAPANIIGADMSDEVVDINVGRLGGEAMSP
jgi:hypothetical protein